MIEQFETRQAVQIWRDDLVLELWQLVNRAGMSAMASLEKDIGEASIVGSLWDPASFVQGRIDRAMQSAIRPGLQELSKTAAEQLRSFDDRYEALAAVLTEAVAASLSDSPDGEAPSPDEDSNAALSAPSGTSRLASIRASLTVPSVVETAAQWGGRALDTLSEVSDLASQRLQSGTGLHDRLRRAGRERVSSAWMATAGTPPPLMAQLLVVVENVCSEARSMAL